MAKIKKYTKKDGTTAYKFNVYLGVDLQTGKKKRTTRQGFSSQKEARLALARLEIGEDHPQKRDGSPLTKKYITFEDVYKAWLESYKNTVKRTTSMNTENFFRNQILPKFGTKVLGSITADYCQTVVNGWAETYTNYKVLKGYAQRVLDYAIRRKLLSDNPFQLVVLPRQEKAPIDNRALFFTKTELLDFLAFMQQQSSYDYALFRVLAYTGMRKCESLALTWVDIDFSRQTVRINKTLADYDGAIHVTTPKTPNSIRTIALDPTTLKILKKWRFIQRRDLLLRGRRIQKDADQLLFPNENNGFRYLDYPNYAMAQYPGKYLTPKGLRHTHASLLFEAGASIKEVQMRLGHSSIQTTMDIYTHVTQASAQATSDKFSAFMNG